MIDLAAYDFKPLWAQLLRLRKAKNFAERQALLEAMDSNEAFQLGASSGSTGRGATDAPEKVPMKALPYSGAAPIVESLSLTEQEWAPDKAGAVKEASVIF